MNTETPLFAAAYQAVLKRCPPLSWQLPWKFLTPDADCRGPLEEPLDTLAHLRQHISDEVLRQGNILVADQGVRELNPALVDSPAVIALREESTRDPFELLTSAGGLSGRGPPLFSVLRDAWTRAHGSHGLLVVSSEVGEVALLRALGWPAALSTELERLNRGQLQLLAATFGEGPPRDGPEPLPPMDDDQSPLAPALEREESISKTGESSPWDTLVLLGRGLLALRPDMCPELARTAENWVEVQTHLGFCLSGVAVWNPDAYDWDNLRFRLTYQDTSLIQPWLKNMATQLSDLEDFVTRRNRPPATRPAIPPPDLVRAHDELSALLQEDRLTPSDEALLATATNKYERLVRRDLITPVMAWAMESRDPVVRNLGMDLSQCFALLHQMAPTLQAAQTRRLRRAPGRDNEPIPAALLAQYLQLTNRVGQLVKSLHRWMFPC